MHQGQLEVVLEQAPIRQAGELVVEGMEADDLLDALALGDVAGDTVASQESGASPGRAGFRLVVEGDRRHHHDDRLRCSRARFAAPAHQAQLHRGRCAGVAVRRRRDLDGERVIGRVDDRGKGTALQLVALEAQHGFGTRVDEREPAFGVERVDDVGRVLDQETVLALRLCQAFGHPAMLPLELAPRQRVGHPREQEVAVLALAHELHGTVAQRPDRGVDMRVPADHDDGRFGPMP